MLEHRPLVVPHTKEYGVENTIYNDLCAGAGANGATHMALNAVSLQNEKLYREKWEKEEKERAEGVRVMYAKQMQEKESKLKELEDINRREHDTMFKHMMQMQGGREPAKGDEPGGRDKVKETAKKPYAAAMALLCSGRAMKANLGLTQLKCIMGEKYHQRLDQLSEAIKSGDLLPVEVPDVLEMFWEDFQLNSNTS